MPARYAELFAGARRALASHRGLDRGALEMATVLADRLGAEIVTAEITRLLVDLNRSPRHPRLWSEWSRRLTTEQREVVLREHYRPYRAAVEQLVDGGVRSDGFVLHVSCHSFAPVLDGETRLADVGLLYDPGRRSERRIAAAWQQELRVSAPDLVVRRNYPYRGVADGLVTHLRCRRAASRYAGMELEVNQKLVGARRWPATMEVIAASLGRALAGVARHHP